MKRCILAVLFSLSVLVLDACADTQEMPENNVTTTAETSSAVTAVPETEQIVQDEKAYYGEWVVQDYQSAAVSVLSTEEMEAFKGYTISYQSDSVLVNGEKVTTDGFRYAAQEESFTEETIVQEYRANLGEWWNGVTEITGVYVTSDDGFFGDNFFVVNDEVIWIWYEGVFFLARKS